MFYLFLFFAILYGCNEHDKYVKRIDNDLWEHSVE